MALYFISDLHLEHQRPAMAAGFKAFVDGLTDAEALYILGDFFEVWMGDDYNDPFVDGVKATLRNAVERGIAVYLMHGNRDFPARRSLLCRHWREHGRRRQCDSSWR